jgi:Tol biopolymer transport system component
VLLRLSGEIEELPLAPRRFVTPRWSPDGRTLAFGVTSDDRTVNLFTYDVVLGTAPRQLTFDGVNWSPVWSPDGSRLAFARAATSASPPGLAVKRVTDDSPIEVILAGPEFRDPTDWPSKDTLVFAQGARRSESGLWLLDMASDSAAASPYLESEEDLDDMVVSPSGDLAAYEAAGTIYVRRYPTPGARERISDGNAWLPMWSPDGTTIYYWQRNSEDTRATLVGARLSRGPPFAVVRTDSIFSSAFASAVALHPDGQRFVLVRFGDEDTEGVEDSQERFVVVVNWLEELERRRAESQR